MKREQREVYITLSDEINFTLCSFCKYEAGGCGVSECKHPLAYRFEDSWGYYGMEPGDDCWGFRPKFSVEDCADIVGIALQNKWCVLSWWEEDKRLLVAGSTEWV